MKKISILFCFVFVTMAFGQTDFKQIVPPNPNVASLFKSVVTPVSEYSGLPNVSVPLYTMTEGGISIPVSISYATGGIQVTEEASTVGLGWALNVGGAITRSVNGLDDFVTGFGYYYNDKRHPNLPPERDPINGAWNPDTHPFVSSLNPLNGMEEICLFPTGLNDTPTDYNLLPRSGAVYNDRDYLPDMFYFNFNGYSGSFVFENDGGIKLLNKKGIRVRTIGPGTGTPDFEISTEDGMVYEFSVRTITRYPNGANIADIVSAWHLKRVTDIYGNIAEFDYDTSGKNRPFRSFTQTYAATTGGSSAPSYSYDVFPGPITESTNVFLTHIGLYKSDGIKTQELKMNYSAPGVRKDMPSSYLESIEILNSREEVVNTYDFSYCYFGTEKNYDYRNISLANGDYGQEIAALDNNYPDLNLRLRLDAVTENNISTHSFEYFNESFVPNKTYMGQDYWGFYNGAYNRDIFIPYIYSHVSQYSIFDQEKKAKRLPSENFAKIFSLKKIHYPTKGSTEFDYELNTYDDNGNFNDAPIPAVPISKRASRVSAAEKDTIVDEISIEPNRFGVLKLTFNVTFTGWSTSFNNGQYANSKPQRPNWQEKFYVEFTDVNGNLMRPRFTIPSDNLDWDNVTVEQNLNYGAVINYTWSEEWRYDVNTQFKLTDDEYKIKAFFDSDNGLYYGSADIKAEWEDVDVSADKQYSIGGGLRVASITDYDNDGSVVTKRNYDYHYKDTLTDGTVVEKSYGKIKTLPNFAIHQIAVLDLAIKKYSDQDVYGALPVTIGSATSHNVFSKDHGSYVGYDQVTITQEGNSGDNGKTVKYFHNQSDHFRSLAPIDYEDSYHKFPPIRVPHNGLLKKQEEYKRVGDNYVLISETKNDYRINGIEDNQFNLFRLYENTDRVISASKELPVYVVAEAGATYWFCDAMKFQLYPYYSNVIQQVGTTQTIWDANGSNPLTTVQEFEYNNSSHYQRTLSRLTNSKGEEVITRTYYPIDAALPNSLGAPELSSNEIQLFGRLRSPSVYRIAEPIQTETTVNGQKTIQRTYYQDWDGDESVLSDNIWPGSVRTLKGTFDAVENPMENRLNYHRYDTYGNPLEVSKEQGVKIAYLWGYRHQYPVAKIENATYDQVLATGVDLTVINDVSKTDAEIRAELQKVRDGLPNAMVTSYTYIPLIGVTSVTDARGYTMYYSYDAHNRLKEVRDGDNHLVSDYQYHYQGENDQQ